MTKKFQLRESRPEDGAGIIALYPDAFPDEDLRPLVRELLIPGMPVLSLIAEIGGKIAGHACITLCGLSGYSGNVALLGPVAVAPAFQARGCGGALIESGLEKVSRANGACVLVLGDPGFYSRFGFTEEKRIETPYAIPDDWRPAWQSVRSGAFPADAGGVLEAPPPWRDPALWAP